MRPLLLVLPPPRYTWSGLVEPMWSIIRWCTRRADLTLVTSKAMKVRQPRSEGVKTALALAYCSLGCSGYCRVCHRLAI